MAVEPTTVHIPASARLCFELMDAEANPQHKQVLFELDQDPEVMRYVTGGKVTSMQMLETKLIPGCGNIVTRHWGGVFGKSQTKPVENITAGF